MNATTMVILGVIVLAVIVIAVLLASRSGWRGRPALKPLAPESRDRYGAQWDRIEAHFVDAPEDAVKEADALLLALLGEREHPLGEDRLPANMRKARRLATGQEGKGGTEGMRQGLLMYRAVIEEYAKPAGKPDVNPDRRREIAS
jgi:hypothetical protein